MSTDIPPTALFPPHLSRPTGFPPNRQPTTVGTEELGRKDTMLSQTTTGAAPELNPAKSAYTGDAVLHTSTRGTVPMGQCNGVIEDSISQCTFLQMTYTAENQHADGITASGARPRFRQPLQCDPTPRLPHPQQQDSWKIDVLSSANCPSTVVLQQRCHHTSSSALIQS